jgi:alpha-galactosidase
MSRQALWILLFVFTGAAFGANVQVDRSANGWTMQNGRIAIELAHTPSGQIVLRSLRNITSRREWAVPDADAGVSLEVSGSAHSGDFQFTSEKIRKLPNGAMELAIDSVDRQAKIDLWLTVRCYPDAAALEFSARIENHGSKTMPLIQRISPLAISVAAAPGLHAYSSAPGQNHGFGSASPASEAKRFADWTVFEDGGEGMMIGGDMGAGLLQWALDAGPRDKGTRLRVGFGFRRDTKVTDQPAFEVTPGETVETPIAFLALAKGDEDDVANVAFRYLKRFVFPAPLPNSPLAVYCIWYTAPRSEELLLDELKFARRIGFEVFYHDASWYEGSSIVPGTNDWSLGLGSYRENLQKFPNGMAAFSRNVRSAGMKFGLWVDPGNVDSRRVTSGEIPDKWLAKIDGKPLQSKHPSLSPMTQLCLGDPEVVAWIEKNLTHIIGEWNLEWLKWDPSGTVNNNCNRTDHGHAARNGSYAAWRGKMQIWSYLAKTFPSLSGFECDPSLQYSRTNPGPRALLPGGYEYEFITGPMVSPLVWGSPYTMKGELTGDWYSASALDYNIRKHFMHGFVFGNIDGMISQRLSAAPAGYIEAFQRNLLFFKQYRHLLLEDVYHPKLKLAENWSSVEYVKADSSEAVVFAFRDGGNEPRNNLKLRGLEPTATYRVTSLNDRPGRDRTFSGSELGASGLDVKLPDDWLVKGDGLPDPRYQNQLTYGSDVILLRKVSE